MIFIQKQNEKQMVLIQKRNRKAGARSWARTKQAATEAGQLVRGSAAAQELALAFINHQFAEISGVQ